MNRQTSCEPQIEPPVQSGFAPQKFRSLYGSMHFPPQAYWPEGHAVPPHCPPTHIVPAAQVAPPAQRASAPQWFGSFCGSTQVPPQFASPGAQDVAQVPFEQTVPAVQTVPFAQVVAPQ